VPGCDLKAGPGQLGLRRRRDSDSDSTQHGLGLNSRPEPACRCGWDRASGLSVRRLAHSSRVSLGSQARRPTVPWQQGFGAWHWHCKEFKEWDTLPSPVGLPQV
jgi:hypothetical protein